MKYFTDDLIIIPETVKELQEECKLHQDNQLKLDELSLPFSQELLQVEMLLTIEKYLKIKSEFYKQKFYDKITSKDTGTIIAKYGVAMKPEVFEEYLNIYNQNFELV